MLSESELQCTIAVGSNPTADITKIHTKYYQIKCPTYNVGLNFQTFI